jgi:OPT family oligopeptide transporter
MAIKQLTQEQIQTMSLEEKDEWWLKNVYRGDMPQLTVRSALTGMFLGGFLSLTNLYIGARTGWTLGVGITSVILSFALFKMLSRVRLANEMTVLENNAMQSIATSAGYMNSALTTSFAAYTLVTGTIIPMYQVMIWLLVVAVLGVLFAFPMKKRFINDEQLPFPEGMAAGVVMDSLHESDEKEGLFKAKLLVVGGFLSAAVEFMRAPKLMRWFFGSPSMPEYYDEYLYEGRLAAWLKARNIFPGFGSWDDKIPLFFRELTIRLDTSLVFLATGGLTGIRTGVSVLVGGILNYFILAPFLIKNGIILPRNGHFGLRQILLWSLWGGVACMTTSSLYAFFAKPKVIFSAFAGLFDKKGAKKRDVLEHIELPMKVSIIGIPIAAGILVVLAHMWFDVPFLMGAIAIPLVFFFSLIATNSTALTSITPVGALGKLTQLTFGVLAPKNITTNLISASITAEVSGNTANLLMDIKPGYMLGGKPRHQAVGHILGAIAGLLVSVPIWYLVFIRGDIKNYGTEQLPVPSAFIWKGVSELLMNGLDQLHPTAKTAVIVGALLGIIIEVTKQITKNKFPLSAVGLGLAFVLDFAVIWTMFLGSFIFWLFERRAAVWEKQHNQPPAAPNPGSREPDEAPAAEQPIAKAPPKKPWFVLASENCETICAGVIAGGALMGILVNVLDVLVLPDVKPAAAIGKRALEILKLVAP